MPIQIPAAAEARLEIAGKEVRLTNLRKPFWPEHGVDKRGLLQYYADVADVLVPHLAGRPMVMKRYPDGAHGPHFFMKRAPAARPEWLEVCPVEHESGNVIDFPVVRDAADLLWLVNLGCIDLNPWYAACDDVHRPDVLHFDLDPVEKGEPVPFARVAEAALRVREALTALRMPCMAKTTGSRGIHVYVPIRRAPLQKQVWEVAKALAVALAARHPRLLTAEYRIAKRPAGRVLVDYNQNAWGRTLASVYSVRPQPRMTVSAPVTWEEVESGIDPAELRLDTVPARLAAIGDLWRPLTWPRRGRFDLAPLLRAPASRKTGA